MSRNWRIATGSSILLLVILAVLAACAPAPAPPASPQVVQQTVVVPQTVIAQQTVVAPQTVVVAPTTAAKKPPHFLFVDPQVGQEGWGNVVNAAQIAAKKYNVTFDVVGPPNQEVDKMISALEAGFAKGGYDGVWTHCIQPSSFTPIINKFTDAGIPVICVADDAPLSKRLTFIGSIEFAAGQQAGKKMIELTGGKAVVGILTVSLTNRA